MEPSLRLVLIRPWNDNFTGMLLSETYLGNPELGPSTRRRLRDLYERNAKTDPAWRRGLRAFEFFSSNFEAAAKLAHELAAENDPRWAYRDVTMAAVIDRVLGKRQPLDDVREHCPGPPPGGFLGGQKPQDACRIVAHGAAHQFSAMQAWALQPSNVPAALRDILAETIGSRLLANRYEAIQDLTRIDPARAESEILAILPSLDADTDVGHDVFELLAFAQNAQGKSQEASQSLDRYLASAFSDPGFTAESWGSFTQLPIRGDDPTILGALTLRVHLAVRLGDYDRAQRVIEQLVAIGHGRRNDGIDVWQLLFELANAEVPGQPARALRIAGYAATRDLPQPMQEPLLALRRRLGSGGKPADPPAQKTPWDSPKRTVPQPPSEKRPAVKT